MKQSKTSPQFTHNDVGIVVTVQGQFCAIVAGRERRAKTLEGIKKIISEAKPFESFDAIYLRGYHSREITQLRIVGTKPNGRRHARAAVEWLDSRGGTHATVIRDTPANRKKLIAAIAEYKKCNAEQEALNERENAIEESIAGEAVPAEVQA